VTTTLPAGLEYKTTGVAPKPARRQRKDLGAATGEWGSEYPEEHGVRNAIVAVTGVRDEVGDIIVPGAFKRTLAKLEPKMCLGHDWNRFVGAPVAYEELMPGDPRLPKKDRLGRPWNPKAGALCTRNRYLLDTPDGQKAYAEVEFQGTKAAFSIGYVPIEKKTWKAVDPDSGLLTRFLGDVDLYEYGPVLHGAHPMAGPLGNKSAMPDLETKAPTRLVRDSAFWGLPIGTPIRAGMKPQGPKARRLANAGKPVSDTAGAVELDPNTAMRIKPTAKGKMRAGKDGALLWDMVDEVQGKFDDEADPHDANDFEVDDTNNINKGEMFNPLDVLVANAMTPADLDEYLRQGEWDSIRVGDAEEQRPEIDSFIDDVVASYRDKYNRELVKQNSDKATEEIPRERGDDPEADAEDDAVGAAATEAEAEADKPAEQPTKLATDLKPGDKIIDSDTGNVVTVSSAKTSPNNLVVVDGQDDEGNIHHSVAKLTSSYKVPADDAEQAPATDAVPEVDAPAAEAPQQPAEPVEPEVPAAPTVAVGADVPIKPDGDAPDAPLTAGNLAVGDQFVSPLTGDTLTVATVSPGRNGRVDVQARSDKGGEFNSFPADQEMERPPADQPVVDTPEEPAAPDAATDEPYVPTGNMNAPEDFTPEQLDAEINAAKELKRELIRRRVPANSAQLADAKMRIKVFEDEKRKRGQAGNAAPPQEVPDGEPSTPDVPDAASAEFSEDNPLAELDDMALETELIDARQAVRAIRTRNSKPGRRPNAAGLEQATQRMNLAEAESNRRQDAGAVENRRRTDELTGGNPEAAAVFDAEERRWVRNEDDGLMYPENPDMGVQGGLTLDELGIDHGPLTPDDAPAAGPEGALADGAVTNGPPAAATAENAARITAEDIAEADITGDASFGIVEAPDGEFEAEPDVADRQDRLAALLIQDEAGTLDLSNQGEDGLRGIRADLVTEIRLQEHLATRSRRDPNAPARASDRTAADDQVEESAPAEPAEDAGPKPRPGVAGAAQDLADALDSGDDNRIAAARARLDSSLNRSRSDSDQVQALRVLLSGETDFTAEDLRAFAEAIKAEQRAKRNDSAKSRRLVRRLERERLRSLLGTVEATMRNRGLSYDPVPDSAPQNTLDRLVNGRTTQSAPVWEVGTITEAWSGFSRREHTLVGTGYTAKLTELDNPAKPVHFEWAVLDDDGNTLAQGQGDVVDADAARTAVEVALDVQHGLGLLPFDSQPPTGNLPVTSSATSSADIDAAVDLMRQRIADGRTLNPLTGLPDPLAPNGTPLAPVSGKVFDDVDAVRLYLSSPGAPKNNSGQVRWDTAIQTPGGAFVVVDNLQGKPQVLHAATGGWFNPDGLMEQFGRADLLRFATIAESLPDRDGTVIDWSLTRRDLVANMGARSFLADGDGLRGVQAASVQALTAEKVRTGDWSSKLVRQAASRSGGSSAKNTSRVQHVEDLRRAIGQKLNSSAGKPSAQARKTLDLVHGADVLEHFGAPDAAAVLLRRHAAELRERFDSTDEADSQGANLLDALANAYLSAHSPQKAPGDRVRSIRPGERFHIAAPPSGDDTDGGPVRTYRVLASMRRNGSYSNESVTTVVDETSGKQVYLKADVSKVWISDDPDSSPYITRTMAGAVIENLSTGLFLVTDPGESTPANGDELAQRSRAEVDVIPADVLDAAAEALPESKPEKVARSAATPPGVRAPRRGSAAAPRRRAPVLAEQPQVRNEDALAVAQGKGVGVLLGIPFEMVDGPVGNGFDSVTSVREFLVALEASDPDPRVTSSARATLARIDNGQEVLSPGGNFLVSKDGYITHIKSASTVWPATQSAKNDLMIGGQASNQAASLKIADALERGAWDGKRVDWSRKGPQVVKAVTEIMKKGQFDPTTTAARSAYLAHVLATPKPKATDVRMLSGMLDAVPEQPIANPENMYGARIKSFELGAVYTLLGGAKMTSGRMNHDFAADTKAGATLAKRVALEMDLMKSLGRVAPLAAVRRLTALADEIGDTVITGVASRRDEGQDAPERRDFTPADDLRALASQITDAFDETKLSPSGSLLRSGWTGDVVVTGEPDVSTPDNFVNRFEVEKNITRTVKDGLRVFVDENGHRHATFGDVDVMDEPSDRGQYRRTGGTVELGLNGELLVEYSEQTPEFGERSSRRVQIKLPAGTWKFEAETTPEPSPNSEPNSDTPELAVPPNEQKVRDAVAKLTTRPGAWVNFTRLREELSDIPRDELDQTLFDMMSQDDVFLIPEANQKVLSEEDRAAAVHIGGEDRHLISIYTNPDPEAEPAAEEMVTVDTDAAMADAFGDDEDAENGNE
jgi:hypothetical protein